MDICTFSTSETMLQSLLGLPSLHILHLKIVSASSFSPRCGVSYNILCMSVLCVCVCVCVCACVCACVRVCVCMCREEEQFNSRLIPRLSSVPD